MVILLLHMLRLLPMLCGGHRQVALENLALRHQLAVYKKMVNRPKRRSSPSQTWRTFLTNHVRDLVSIDFFTVSTARLRVLFVFVVLAHDRRRVLHFNVTEHPTAAWTAQQIIDAFPEDSAPSYLLRDRDSVYGHVFRQRVKGMGVGEVLTTPQSPWQNPFAERLIGSIRRECLDHVVVLGERHLRRIPTAYFAYYHRARTHLSLDNHLGRGSWWPASPLRPARGVVQHRPVFPSLRPARSSLLSGDPPSPGALVPAGNVDSRRALWGLVPVALVSSLSEKPGRPSSAADPVLAKDR
jgi:transposase InsO family protein